MQLCVPVRSLAFCEGPESKFALHAVQVAMVGVAMFEVAFHAVPLAGRLGWTFKSRLQQILSVLELVLIHKP